MKVIIHKSTPHGSVCAPPSKSIAHRMIICAALASGESRIGNIALSDDITATLRCIQNLGADYALENNILSIKGSYRTNTAYSGVFNCNESGSTLRFLLPLAMLSSYNAQFSGSRKLLSRPLSVYEKICRDQGLPFRNNGENLFVRGPLQAGDFSFPGDVSSQFVSGLLMALSMLEKNSRILLKGDVESRPYIDMTMQVQRVFGVHTTWENDHTILIPGGQHYVPQQTQNEGDWSNAAFLYALQYSGAKLQVTGVSDQTLQGDSVCKGLFEKLSRGFCRIDISDCPDLGPILFSFAAIHYGAVFTGVKRLRLKESDRIAAMKSELQKFGCKLLITDNEVTVPAGISKPTEPLFGHNDHRIVMSMAVLCTQTGGEITGAEAVNKSYPVFFRDLETLKVKVEYEA